MRYKLFFLAFLIGLPLLAQSDSGNGLNNYLGPGVSSPAIGDLGTASGQAVDLRFYGGVSGVYDTNVQPFVTDTQGNRVNTPDLVGIAYNAGFYGSHNWLHSKLALSYTGDYREYPNHTSYDGTNQSLTLAYTMQPSSRWILDARASGFLLNQSAGVVADQIAALGQASSLPLFDVRTYMGSGSASVTYLLSARNSFTFGGGASTMRYQSGLFTEYSTEFANASFMHRLSRRHSIGLAYSFSNQTSSTGSYSMVANTVAGQYAGELGHGWIMNLSAGASYTHTQQLVAFQLLSAGETFNVVFPSDAHNIFPTGSAGLKRQFQHALLSADYSLSAGGSSGLSQASRSQTAHGGVSYTGIRKWNIGVDGTYTNFVGFATGSGKSEWYGGGMGFTYELMRYVHIVARIDALHYELGGLVDRRTTERATLGLNFTPKDIPLALW